MTFSDQCGDVIPSGAERQADSAVLPGAEPSGCSLPRPKEPGLPKDWQANRQTLALWNQGTVERIDGSVRSNWVMCWCFVREKVERVRVERRRPRESTDKKRQMLTCHTISSSCLHPTCQHFQHLFLLFQFHIYRVRAKETWKQKMKGKKISHIQELPSWKTLNSGITSNFWLLKRKTSKAFQHIKSHETLS